MSQRDYANQFKFWVVWNPLGNAPTVRHETEEYAASEAFRLARLNKGQRFYLLEATEVFVTNEVQRIRLVDTSGETPF